jgi:DNA-directed RNA polymerase subunit beta'
LAVLRRRCSASGNAGRAFPAGFLLDEDAVELIEALGIDEVRVRTPLTCETRYGLCAKCYGRDLGRGMLGQCRRSGWRHCRPVDRRARHPADDAYLPRRWCGIACGGGRAQVEAKSAGVVRFTQNMRYVTNPKGEKVVIARSGEVMVTDDHGRERERHKVPYGAMLRSTTARHVKAGAQLATWDPHTRPIVTEYAGTVKFENVEEARPLPSRSTK